MEKKKKKQPKKESQEILKILFPDQLKKVNENWCGTVSRNEPKRVGSWVEGLTFNSQDKD